MICPNCSTNNPDSTKFCTTCGTRLGVEAKPQQSQPQQQTPPPQQQYQPPQQQYQPPQQQYQPPQQNYQPQPNYQPVINKALTTGQFFLMDLVLVIPLVGLIMYFVWAFGSDENANRKAWAKAKLIWILIGFVISIVIAILFGSVILYVVDELSYYLF